ncbi:hypothetical protein NCCP2716_29640 [Sporosarcina sp. NCCP-2716]|uniref:transposase n=1 Tax=Sporosarcina sp. NCCP-2716 TaxID=2943679 RepID=UPI00203A5D86|nr:transposase [Sporosarcina sp. NCCP-2716]GKV70466.1 hypothetical protein NCCP2716_29640 [Sporosarcina sp. NCCP-2716]
MGRRKRDWHPGIYYHVTMRGNNRADIFLDESDKRSLLGFIADARERFTFTMLAYCIMSNHYHFLMNSEDDLGKIMQRINRRYSDYYSKRYGHVGRIYQSRYYSGAAVGPRTLRIMSRYIHRNPIDTKRPLVEELRDYPFSSFPLYADGERELPKYMDTRILPSCLGPPFEQTAAGYLDYCLQDEEEEEEE